MVRPSFVHMCGAHDARVCVRVCAHAWVPVGVRAFVHAKVRNCVLASGANPINPPHLRSCSRTHAHTHARARTHEHARTRPRAHTLWLACRTGQAAAVLVSQRRVEGDGDRVDHIPKLLTVADLLSRLLGFFSDSEVLLRSFHQVSARAVPYSSCGCLLPSEGQLAPLW